MSRIDNSATCRFYESVERNVNKLSRRPGVVCNRRNVHFCIAVADTISLSLRFNELRSANLHKYDTVSRAIDHTAI